MSTTPQTEAQRLADFAKQLSDEGPMIHALSWPQLSGACQMFSDELLRLDALCDERGTNEARMLMRLTEMQKQVDQLRAQLAKAVAEEREACAKVCEYQADRFMQASPLEGNRPYASHECAAAIRARSNT